MIFANLLEIKEKISDFNVNKYGTMIGKFSDFRILLSVNI